MRILQVLLIASVLPGCVFMSDKYYDAEKAMWEAKRDVSIAWANKSNQPLATFTAVSGETFCVNNPNVQAPVPITGEPSAIVQGLGVVLNSTPAKILSGGWAAGYMMGKVQGNYTAGDNGSINVTRDSGNTNTFDSEENSSGTGGDLNIEKHNDSDYDSSDNSDNSDNSDASNNSDNSDNRTDYSNQTADPTIVEQPDYNDPIIVEQPDYNDPIIVDPAPYNDPVIVQPTVVNPPDPIIVEQPPYNDPIIVDPTIIEQPPYNDPIIVQPTVIEQPPYNDPIIVQPVIVPQGGTL